MNTDADRLLLMIVLFLKDVAFYGMAFLIIHQRWTTQSNTIWDWFASAVAIVIWYAMVEERFKAYSKASVDAEES